MKSKLNQMFSQFLRCERGSAMTEFTFFLPIWIMMMVAILSLGRVGMVATEVQLKAQSELWSKAIPLTAPLVDDSGEPDSDDEEYGGWVHVAPVSGYGHAAVNYGELASKRHNPQRLNDGLEAGFSGKAGLPGRSHHFVESADKYLGPHQAAELPEGFEVTSDPNDLLGKDTKRFAHKTLNDAITTSKPTNVMGVIEKVAKLTGAMHHTGAGAQYGSVFAEQEVKTDLFGQWGSVHAEAALDTLVPPKPLTGHATKVSAVWSMMAMKTDDKYKDFMQWGKENWGGNSGAGEDYEQDYEKEIKKAEKECKRIKDRHDKEQEKRREQNLPTEEFDRKQCSHLGGN